MKKFSTLLLFSWMLFIVVAHSIYTPCDLCFDRATPSVLASMELRLYTGQTLNDYTSVRISEALKLMKRMDKRKPTAVYISGFRANADRPTTKAIIRAYIARGDHNVILLDWFKISRQHYPYVLSSVNGVGFTLAKALSDMVSAGLSLTRMNLIGHSIGAQISGYVGRYVNFNLPRITGLDPAGIGFYGSSERLSPRDAQFVVVIHSDIFIYGINLAIGTVNFYPNGGFRPQPGCATFDICSHYRACDYYAESVINERAFLSLKCDSYSKFQQGSCALNEKEVMGYATPNTARGIFYLHTKSESPYDLGDEGLTYKPSDSVINNIAYNSIKNIFLP